MQTKAKRSGWDLNERASFQLTADKATIECWLRSWVQLPPGPFLTVVQIRHYFELDFNNCRTNIAAMPMSYTSDADNEYRTPRNLENNILSLNLFIHWEKRKIDR
jgi:hypothetical protein